MIRTNVYEFFLNVSFILNKVLEAVNKDDQLPKFKRTKMFEVLKKLGFTFSIRGKNAFLIDREDIILW